MINGAYSAIGGIFERLNKDCGYFQWSQYLIKTLKCENAGLKGADVGCGNGYFTRALEKSGYDMIGIDSSPEMLSEAVNLARKEGIRAPFVQGDIKRLALGFKADFIVAINDVINYIPQTELEKTFKKVHSNLKKGGIFIFDISSEYKLRTLLGNNLFCEDEEDYSLIWFNTLFEDRVEMNLTLYSSKGDGVYSRKDERHIQYIHSESGLLQILQSAGFTVRCEGHLGGSKEQRINFICKKI
ncbi:MAG: class I SAM-dependent methyltransferase [Clostridiales bacterium]|nr:class I SAM-dependent methyltransferase [Clostridiales bacterium]